MKKEASDRDNTFGVASVLLGIQSVVLTLFSQLAMPAIIFGVIGVVFSFKQQKVSRNKWSKRGKILSIIGTVLGILSIIAAIWLSKNYPELLNQANRGFNVAS